jgi:alkanesulfonate monooxygenase SsuD/methylene tetrahydromethanopterin reductase-like flavin-dependent oxidoreductase (luciferase family)
MLKFDVGVPSGAIKHFEAWVGEGSLNQFAVAAEKAGIDAVNVTDHPFPEDAWMASGGHHAFDPFVALSSMAAVTTRIALRTNLLVAGYRNPYLMARSIASLDVLSRGRVIVGMGAGYLKPEFEVLGGDFGHRGKKFDEAIEAGCAAGRRLAAVPPARGHVKDHRQPSADQSRRPASRHRRGATAAGRRGADGAVRHRLFVVHANGP